MAAYTRCLRCAGAPRRPASGSGLSLLIPSWHAALSDPGGPTSLCSRTSMPTWPSPFDHRLGTPEIPAIRFARGADFVASLVRFRYGLPGCSPPARIGLGHPSPRGLLLPGFRRVGHPPRRWIYDIDWTPMSAGLAPAGRAASFAVLAHQAAGEGELTEWEHRG
jgi:hypothetical protein